MRASCKERVLAVERILQRRKRATRRQIMNDLQREYDMTADPKSFYDDINTLTLFLPINFEKHGRGECYYILEDQ